MSEQNENKKNAFTAKILQVGTAECAIFFAVVAMVLAVLMLYLGFWKTLLIAALVCVGLFLGGVKNKKEWLTQWINRLFPPKSNVPYRATKDDLPPSLKEEQFRKADEPQDPTEE